MSNCSSGCPTQDHETYGQCLKAKNMAPLWINPFNDYTAQKKWQADIDAYRSAHRQGIRPDGSSRKHVDAAVKWSEKNGKPYRARGRENG